VRGELPEIRGGVSSPARFIRHGKLTFALIAVPVVAGVAAVLVLAIFATDSDKYGRVAVPGQAVLALDEGRVDVFYSEDTILGADSTLHEPEMDITIASSHGGDALDLEGSSSVINIDGLGAGAATSLGRIEVETAGQYRVGATGEDALNRDTPEVTLGVNPAGALGDRGLDLLFSPWSLAYVALVLLIPHALRRLPSRGEAS
jgi:hypothetical protein